MRLVVIESPLAGDVARNLRYLRDAILDCLKRGEAPYASHGFFPQALDDLVPEERALGIQAGCAWGDQADATVVYEDLGISSGMKYGIERAAQSGRPIEYRTLEKWRNKT
jgi:hypothetical protein